MGPAHGIEWIVDASGCIASRLRDSRRLQRLFRTIVRDLRLHPIGEPNWHRFPDPGGVTGIWMLQESHLACHTFPEYASICINLFCCRPRPVWPWEERLAEHLGARVVSLRSLDRRYTLLPRSETA